MPEEFDKRRTQAVWGASPAGTTYGGGAEPGTKEFFESVLAKRSTYELPWLFEVVPFCSWRDHDVLEIGCGAGYDAYEIVRNGARYTGIDITPENPERVRKHLGLFGYQPNVMQADAEQLPFSDQSFDVVFSNGVLHHTPDMPKAFREASRVVRPGGRFWVVVYNRNSVFYRVTLGVFDHIIGGGWRTRSLRERLAMIEFTTSDELPLVNVYSPAELSQLLRDAGFKVERTWVRKLVVEDLPAPGKLGWVWRRIPQRWLDTVGRRWGWYAIAEAEKPVNP